MAARALILSDANIGSLLACACAAEELSALDDAAAAAARPIVMPFRLGEPLTQTHIDAVAIQTRHYALTECPADRRPASATASSGTEGEREAVSMLSACHLAASLGCARVIWPVSAAVSDSLDLDRLAAIADRALVVSRLASLDTGPLGVTIEAPYAELTDRQVADLALDVGAALETCWWWNAAGGRNANKFGNSERTRWTQALIACGWAAARA
ncbi:MAG: hypothetical protein U0637_03675 [Phycisphaerales bacterium]